MYLCNRTRSQIKAATTPRPLFTPPRNVLQRKCACGGTPGPTGECEECSKKKLLPQTKFPINEPGDIYEQEADRAATPAPFLPPISTRMLLQRKSACGGSPGPSGQCEERSEKKLRPQTKLLINELGDIYEQEADRIANQVIGTPESFAIKRARLPIRRFSTASSGQMDVAPVSVDQTLASPGRPLDQAFRHKMEQRFGYDFGRVRIHADERAAKWADAIHALAFTSGTSIVFSRHAYDPHSRMGQHLLAHELTHVVQQAGSPGLAIQRKPKPAPSTVWYQEAIDEVELDKRRFAEQRKRGEFEWSPNFDTKKALLELCESVDRKEWDVVPTKLDALLKTGLWVHLQILSRSLLTELTARMYELGLEADAQRLRKAYADEELALSGRFKMDLYASRRRVDFVTRLVDGANREAKSDTPEALKASMHKYVRTFVPLRDEYLTIDWEGVEHERSSTYGYRGMRPGMGHEEFYLAIKGQIERWLRGLSTLVQTAMDSARRDLESPKPTGSGAALLKSLQAAMVGELHDELFPKDVTKNIAGVTVPITHTKLGKGKGTIADEFAQGKEAKARAVAVTTYDPEQDYVRELQSSLEHFWQVRMDQLDVLGRVYGVLEALGPPEKKTFAATMEKAEKALDTAETVRRMSGGRMRLDSDDDWRVFLLQRYQDLTNPKAPAAPATQSGTPVSQPVTRKSLTPAEALHEIIDLLFAYLRAFTVHARFTNIYDAGETYLNRPFPRALTGQLVHDCGVYAVRVAYMLSLVRKELGLRFRFVTLPVHVSLVITGDKLPAFIVENDQFTEISAADLEERRKIWQKYKDPTTGAAPAGPADEEQFIGELAATEFIRGPIDMPFKVTDVPPPVSDAKKEQRQLWDYYQKVGTQDVFGPSSQKKGDPNYLFHKHYLELTERFRQAYNETFVPFWNKAAPDAWDKFQARLLGDPAKPRKTVKVDDLFAPLGEYRVDFEDARKAVKARYDSLQDEERRLSQRLRSDPKLSKPAVGISVGARASMFYVYYWESHFRAIENYENDLVSRPEGAEEQMEQVGKRLAPPFIPRDEKHVDPLD